MRTIAIGDVHGCLEELDELLTTVGFRKDEDRLVFLGDIVDRGPEPVGVVRRVQELGAECLMGNHEEKHVRAWRWERKVREGKAPRNPMRAFSDRRQKEHDLLAPHAEWLSGLPDRIRLDDPWVAVHAGLAPGIPFRFQEPNVCMRVRYVDVGGEMVGLKEDLSAPTGSHHWSTLWRGPEWVVYGHYVSLEPFATDQNAVIDMGDEPPHIRRVVTLGIDTGCCFGMKLTAAIIGPDGWETTSVPSKQPES